MEKIKISLSKYTYEILTKDMENFEIVKDNGELNKNEFLNRLIINYTDTFSNESKEQIERIDTIIDRYVDLDEIDKINLGNELVKSFRENMFFHDIDGTSVIVSVKPTKMSEPIITYLFDEVIQNQSISSYFREMFDSYANLTQNTRERIIFKDVFNELVKSIEKSKKVFVTLRNKDKTRITASLYHLADSKDELFNYCLFQLPSGFLQTIRLSKIASVKILNEPASFKDENIPLLEFQAQYCIQHPVGKNDFDEVKVHLTEVGKKLYKKIYLYRPNYIRSEGDDYYFLGSHDYIFNYFIRFGRHAIIQEPLYLKKKMEDFYLDSEKAYKK